MTKELVPVEYDGFIVQLAEGDIAVQRSAISGIEEALIGLNKNREAIEIVEARIYHAVKRLWDDEVINQEIRNMYENDFYNWAKTVSLKGSGEVSSGNIGNKIRVYDTWFSEDAKIEPPPQVYLPIEGNEDEVLEVDFNLADVPFTKLLVSTVPASKGDMDEDCWAGLVNPEVTLEELKRSIKKARNIDKGDDDDDLPKSELSNSNGILYYSQNGVQTEVAQLLYSDHPLNQFAINYILQAFGLESDEDYLEAVDRGNIPTVKETEEGYVQLGCRGTTFATYTKDEVKQIHILLGELLEENNTPVDTDGPELVYEPIGEGELGKTD